VITGGKVVKTYLHNCCLPVAIRYAPTYPITLSRYYGALQVTYTTTTTTKFVLHFIHNFTLKYLVILMSFIILDKTLCYLKTLEHNG